MVLDTYENRKDGVLIYVKKIIPEIKDKFHVKLVAPKYSNDKIFDVETYLFPYIKINVSNYYPAIPKRILKKIISDSDIIFVHDLAPLGLFSSILSKKLGKKLVIFCHHDERIMLEKALNLKGLFLVDKIVGKIYNMADLILVATGKFYKKIKRLKIPEEKVKILPFGVDIDTFKPRNKIFARKILGLPCDKKIVLYLGRISHEKNLKTLIKASKYFDEDTILLIVGGGKHLEYYKKLSKKYSKNIIFTGQVEHEVTRYYYNAADIFVSVSFHESQSFTVMEAMASGLATIVSHDFDSYTYLKDSFNCIFVKNLTDEREVYEKIRELLSNDSLRRYIGRNARKTMMKYSWETHVKKLIEYLSS